MTEETSENVNQAEVPGEVPVEAQVGAPEAPDEVPENAPVSMKEPVAPEVDGTSLASQDPNRSGGIRPE